MDEYQYPLFNIDTENMSYLDIRKWLIECRKMVVAPNGDKTDLKYQEDLIKFTDEWHRHYENNKSYTDQDTKKYVVGFYDSYNFHKALLSLTARPITIKTIIGKKKITLDNVMSCIKAPDHNPFAKMLEEAEESNIKTQTSKYYNEIKDCFAEQNKAVYKKKLDDILKNGFLLGACYEIKVFEDTKKAKSKLYMVDTDEELKALLNEMVVNKTIKPKLVPTNKPIKYTSFKDLIEKHSISTGIYSEFMSKNYQEKDFKKNIYVNLGFLLSLPSPLFNVLLSYGGYSVTNSTRMFDIIIDRSFKLGYGRDIAEGLIMAHNNMLYNNNPDLASEIPYLD